ncbi:MAG: DMT family transporter [Acidimicrobiia bacterium]
MTHLSALVGIVAISFSAIFVRLADVSPTTAALFRAAYAIPFLFAVHLARRHPRPRRARVLAFSAGVLLAVDLTMWHIAIEYIGAGLATVVANVQVVWVGIVAWMVYREKPTNTAFAVVPMVLVGIALIGGLGRDDAFGARPLLGALLAAGASITYTGFLLLFRASNRSLGPTAAPLLEATAGAALAMFLIAPFDAGFSLTIEFPAHGWLIALAIIGQVFGWLLIAGALPRLPALETSVMLLVQPALTVLWARLLFDESLAAIQWTGVAIVMTGVAVAGARGSVRPPAATEVAETTLPGP